MALYHERSLPGFWIFSYKMETFPSPHSHKGYHRVRLDLDNCSESWRHGVYQVSGTGSSVCCLLDSANVLHRLRRPSCVRLLWTTCRAVSGVRGLQPGPAPASHRCTSLSRTEVRCRTDAAAGKLWHKLYRSHNRQSKFYSFIWKWKTTTPPRVDSSTIHF